VVDPGLFRGAVVEAGMGALAVIKHFDVFGFGHASSGPGGEDLLVVHFVFQTGEKRLSDGVVPADSGATHRLGDPSCSAVGRKFL